MFLSPTTPDRWPSPQTTYEARALAFCRAWLDGQTEFTLQTSGSTGTPKPIRLRRAQMQASARLTGQTLGLQPGDASLVCLNVQYVAGSMMLVRGLELGLPMTVIEPSGNPLADFDTTTDRFSFAAFVPLQLQSILANTPNKVTILNGMKAILVGGAATGATLEQALQVIKAPIYATYGMTETVSHIALRRLNGPGASDVFTALDGVELGVDERNCLHITSAATNFDLVQTNDVVELIEPLNAGPAHFRLLGRADNIINTGGVKVQAEQVEQVILAGLAQVGVLPIPRLFVAGLPDERLGQRVVVFLEKQVIHQDRWAVIQETIRQQIGPYAVVKEAIRVDNFMETPTGKIDRLKTIERYC